MCIESSSQSSDIGASKAAAAAAVKSGSQFDTGDDQHIERDTQNMSAVLGEVVEGEAGEGKGKGKGKGKGVGAVTRPGNGVEGEAHAEVQTEAEAEVEVEAEIEPSLEAQVTMLRMFRSNLEQFFPTAKQRGKCLQYSTL
jgi:hypothetical protein